MVNKSLEAANAIIAGKSVSLIASISNIMARHRRFALASRFNASPVEGALANAQKRKGLR
jgi:hypothetical protein